MHFSKFPYIHSISLLIFLSLTFFFFPFPLGLEIGNIPSHRPFLLPVSLPFSQFSWQLPKFILSLFFHVHSFPKSLSWPLSFPAYFITFTTDSYFSLLFPFSICSFTVTSSLSLQSFFPFNKVPLINIQ